MYCLLPFFVSVVGYPIAIKSGKNRKTHLNQKKCYIVLIILIFFCFEILMCYLAAEAVFAGAVVVVELDEGL